MMEREVINTARNRSGWEARMRGEAQQTTNLSTQVSPTPELRAVPMPAQTAASEPDEDSSCPPCHWGMLAITLLLMGISIPLVYSASTALALDNNDGSTYFLWRQITFVLLGLVVLIGTSRIPRNWVKYAGWGLYTFTLVGLLATKWSPWGVTMGGVERWLRLGPVPFQVSEVGKIALLMVLAHYWSRTAKFSHKSTSRNSFPWLVSGLLLTAPVVLLVLMQPHLSAALLLFCLFMVISFFAGTPLIQYAKVLGGVFLILAVVFGLSSIGKMPLIKPYQQARIAHFFGPQTQEQGANYQTLQGLRAMERGGWLGVGPGNSLYKQGHLPAPHTDFILAVIGEEWGAVGMLALLALYGTLIFFCLQVGHNAENSFEMLVAVGMGALLFMQVFLNMSVVLNIIPVTGMPLPFISYGGSGLICLLLGMGFVLGISRHQGRRINS